MKIRTNRAVTLGFIAAGAALGPGQAYAQSVPAPATQSDPAGADSGSAHSATTGAAQEGDIVVRARRRAEPLQRTPVAVTAISEQGLENMTVRNVQDVAALAPNLQIQSGRTSSTNAFIFIRGIGQGDDAPAFEPGVAQYVDDVYLGRVSGGLMNIADVASVEILRGPQGTLYGKNTIGGAFKITSKIPEPDFSGTATLGFGNYDQFVARGAINAPITDKLYMRISGQRSRNSGYMRNSLTGKGEGNLDSYSGRLMLRWVPTDTIDWLVSGDVSRSYSNGNAGRIVATAATPIAGLVTAFVGDITPYVLRDKKDFFNGRFDAAVDPFLPNVRPTERAGGVSSRLRIGDDDLSFTSITAYRTLLSITRLDVDATPLQIAHLMENIDQNQFSQELQIAGQSLGGRLNWIGGLFYYRENIDVTGYATLVPAFKALGLDISQSDFAYLGTKSYAGYANASFKITPSLTLSLGGRYSHEERQTKDVIEATEDGTTITSGPLNGDLTTNRFLPRIGLEYQATPDIFAYATYSTGFKSGGFDSGASFGPEKATSYEVGLKTQWLNRHLTLNLAGFYVNYSGIQLAVVTVKNNVIGEFVSNASRATLYGGEAEMRYHTGGASLFANFAFTKAQYDEYFDLTLGDLSGRKFPYTPVFAATVGGDYTFPIGSGGHSGFVGFDLAYKTKTFTDVPNTPQLLQKGYALLNTRIALRGPDEKYEVAVFAKNLTDTRYYQYGISLLDSFGFGVGWQGAPRTYGVEATVRF